MQHCCELVVVERTAAGLAPCVPHPDGGTWGAPFKHPSVLPMTEKQVKSKLTAEMKRVPIPEYLASVSCAQACAFVTSDN